MLHVALLMATVGGCQADTAGRAVAPAVRASPARSAIRVDGRLDEPAWRLADSIPALTQVEPQEGSPPPFRTIVRVLVLTDALVIGVVAEDPEPAGIVSYTKQRDADLTREDHVRLVLDTFRDGRSGYVFAVSPRGARYDALVGTQGGEENANWDAVWKAATARMANGWSVEILIPVKSLLFRPGLTQWGFNVQRRIQRRQETDRWASAQRDIALTQTSRAGLLTDLPRFDLGLGLSVRPSLTGGGARDAAGAPLRGSGHVSLDVSQRLGANTLASLSANTDFAETEVDTRQVNLTRFPLFFPEKRTFFLEGADIFDFGLGPSEDVIPFFSRRIGLLAGQQVPIDIGAKVNGRLGGSNFGVLAVRTRDVDTLPTANTMAVLRLKQNVLRESSVGVIGTAGDPLGRPGSWLAGPDLTYQTSHFRGDKNLLVGAWGLVVGREDLGSGDRTAAGVGIAYPNDLWDVSLTYQRAELRGGSLRRLAELPVLHRADQLPPRERRPVRVQRRAHWRAAEPALRGRRGRDDPRRRVSLPPLSARGRARHQASSERPSDLVVWRVLRRVPRPVRAHRRVEAVGSVHLRAQRGARRRPHAGGTVCAGSRGHTRAAERVSGPATEQLRPIR